jgi:hypothetical protein
MSVGKNVFHVLAPRNTNHKAITINRDRERQIKHYCKLRGESRLYWRGGSTLVSALRAAR